MKKEQKEFIKKIADWFFTRGLASLDVSQFIGCQFALESQFGQSNLALNHCNFCAMKVPKRRINVANGDSGYAYYTSINMCLSDYTLWLAWHNFEKRCMFDLNSFMTKLDACGYCPESDYISKIINLLKSYKNE